MSACATFEYSSRAIGEEARTVRTQEENIESEYLSAIAVGAELRSAIAAIVAAVREHDEDDWDGYGATRVSLDAAAQALRLIKLLPTGAPVPQISADPDGDISLEWCRDRRWVFSVSVTSRGELNYAGLFGANPVHGKETHFEDELPLYVRAGVNRVTGGRR